MKKLTYIDLLSLIDIPTAKPININHTAGGCKVIYRLGNGQIISLDIDLNAGKNLKQKGR